jgi:hypothetical protein
VKGWTIVIGKGLDNDWTLVGELLVKVFGNARIWRIIAKKSLKV